ncbi:MAG: hypothetical protein Q8L14_06045 [Myxococcales bacterium]|nr:hypothetical protein [Myxococcales bacterium]
MAFIQKLMNSATGAAASVGAQAKAAAKQVAREAQLPALIIDKAVQLQKIDKELSSLGWSPSPEVKARKAELGQQRREVSTELAGLQQEVKANQEKAKEAQRNRMNMLR